MNKMITKVNLFQDKDNPIYGKSVTSIEVLDECAGTFLEVTQYWDDNDKDQVHRFDLDEVEKFIKQLQFMAAEASKYKG